MFRGHSSTGGGSIIRTHGASETRMSTTQRQAPYQGRALWQPASCKWMGRYTQHRHPSLASCGTPAHLGGEKLPASGFRMERQVLRAVRASSLQTLKTCQELSKSCQVAWQCLLPSCPDYPSRPPRRDSGSPPYRTHPASLRSRTLVLHIDTPSPSSLRISLAQKTLAVVSLLLPDNQLRGAFVTFSDTKAFSHMGGPLVNRTSRPCCIPESVLTDVESPLYIPRGDAKRFRTYHAEELRTRHPTAETTF